jgi:hypothetical protein
VSFVSVHCQTSTHCHCATRMQALIVEEKEDESRMRGAVSRPLRPDEMKGKLISVWQVNELTSASCHPCRPVKHLKVKTVFWEFTTAWCSAGGPTRHSRQPTLSEHDNGGHCPCTSRVLDDTGSLALHDGDARIGCSHQRA